MKKGVDYIGVGCGAMIFNSAGKVFVSKRGKGVRNEVGKWDFPGGGVKFGERCEDALKREIREEHDIEIEVVDLLEVVDHIIPEEKQHWVSPSYIAKLVSGEAKILEPEKCEEMKWINLSEINLEMLTLTSKSDFNKYIEKFGYNSPAF